MTALSSALLDLLRELEGRDLPLIVGGGYGIYLRYGSIVEERRRTLFAELPEPRSTNDLDLFLRAELLLNSAQLKPLKDAMTRLGYEAIKGAEHYQFVRPGPGGDPAKGIKIDVLTGPTTPFKGTPVKFDRRRVKPNPPVDLHAHPCEEALTLVQGMTKRIIRGALGNGREHTGEVWIPHPFTFLTMKLFALRDRLKDPEKDFGRHHAMDLYAVMGTLAPAEWDECRGMRAANGAESVVVECGRIVADLFAGRDSMGAVRLREHAYFRPGFQVDEFIGALKELFGLQG